MDEFIAHWTQCNVYLGAQPLVVVVAPEPASAPAPPPVTLAAFSLLRTGLLANQQAVQAALNGVQIARSTLAVTKNRLLTILELFRGTMAAFYQGTVYADARPGLPQPGDGQDRFCQPMMDAVSLWQRMNAGPPVPGVTLPLVLPDGQNVDGMRTALATLQAQYAAERTAVQEVTLARAVRNQSQDAIYKVLKAYRQTVPPRLVLHPVMVETMPRLAPLPGHTPQPVQASAVLVPPDESKVVYEASAEPTLAHYVLEGCNGEEFHEEDAVVVATHAPGEPREFLVRFGLTQPGTAAAFKVFVVLTTGNRAGSAAVVVRRPL